MIKVAIVDDEQTICDKIKNILLKFDDIRTYTYNSLSLLDQEYDFICLLESVVSSKLLFFFESLHMETFIYGIHHFAKTKEEYKTAYLITDEVI